MNSQFNKGVIEMCVLSLVSRRDFYGYELVDTISRKVDISEGTIYPILRRLTQEQYFETYLQESSEGPPRKYYRMTPHGRKETEKLIKDWKRFTSDVNSILTEGDRK
ncbi:MAG: PadR family transcriptional regulator [Bdellovibrionales bacterium]|nr:PadR family transcriptional regulator [Oligoflexia bacterium]